MSLDVQGDQSSSDETVSRPMNGDEYVESLRDGRQIYIHGKRVEDVTTHPAFRNSVRSIARLYNALHDPATKDVLTTETDTGSGGYTHPFFKAPHSAADLVAGRDAIAAWQRLTYGWMGRSPDYKAAFLATYGPNADYYAPFADNARRWYKEAQERVYFMNHTLVNPPVDRDKEIHEVSDVFIHAVKETDEGVVVRGAKMVATGSALSNYNFVSYHGNLPIKKEEYALSFFAPMDHPNIKLLCRPSYEFIGRGGRQPVRLPALEPLRRERLGADVRRRADPVGELPDLPQPRDRQHLPPHGVHLAGDAPGLHAPGGQARLHRRRLHQGARGDGDDRLPRHPGQRRRDPRLAQHLLGADRRHVPQPGARRPRGASSPTTRPARPTGSSRTSRSPRSRRSSRTRSRAR